MSIPYRAILFDFDGTLADSYAAITASVNHVRAHHELPPFTETQVRGLVGNGLLQLMKDIVPGGNPDDDAKLYHEHHPTVMFDYTQLLPGVAQALADLHAASVKLAVCSNKPVAITRMLLDAMLISRLFDAALGPEDAGKPKPDPAMVDVALKKLGVSKSESLFVGDMPVDVETARNAGLTVWVLPTGSSDLDSLKQAKPDRILTSMDELIPALMGRK
jgi:phosphoglycolate phosphatase